MHLSYHCVWIDWSVTVWALWLRTNVMHSVAAALLLADQIRCSTHWSVQCHLFLQVCMWCSCALTIAYGMKACSGLRSWIDSLQHKRCVSAKGKEDLLFSSCNCILSIHLRSCVHASDGWLGCVALCWPGWPRICDLVCPCLVSRVPSVYPHVWHVCDRSVFDRVSFCRLLSLLYLALLAAGMF